MLAITGRLGLTNDVKRKYANAAYFDLIKAIVPIRESFRGKRKEPVSQAVLAQKELNHWLTYLERRKEIVSTQEEYWIQDGSKALLKEAFDRHRNRNTMCVDSSDLIDMHASFAKTF